MIFYSFKGEFSSSSPAFLPSSLSMIEKREREHTAFECVFVERPVKDATLRSPKAHVENEKRRSES